MKKYVLTLFLILAGTVEAGTETRREVVCRVRCRTNPSDVTLIVKGVKESFYKNGFCGLQMFNFAPTNAKVGISTEEKATIIEELPKLDMGMCHWGCKNEIYSHAVIWNISNIVKGFKQTQALKHPKVLKTEILFDMPSSIKIHLLREILTVMSVRTGPEVYRQYLSADDTPASQNPVIEHFKQNGFRTTKVEHPDEFLEISKEDLTYFFDYVVPTIVVKTVSSKELGRKRKHIDYRYDFD